MNNGKMPNIVDLGNEYTAVDTGVTWWPTNYINTSNVTFSIDSNNTYIKYTNIFSSIPSDINIIGIFAKNIALKQDAMINILTLDMIIPLQLKTIEFLKSVSNIYISGNSYIENHVKSYMACNAGRDNDTLYEANGSGDFDVYICNNGVGWELQPIFKLKEYFDSTIVNVSGVTIANMGIKRVIYADFNNTTLNKKVLINNIVNNLSNAKEVKK